MNAALLTTAAIVIGFFADLLLGERVSSISPAVLFGKLIWALEPPLRRLFPATKAGERAGGAVMAVIVCSVALVAPALLLRALGLIHPLLPAALTAFWTYQLLACRGLADAANAVREPLVAGDLPGARHAVSMIVGRDTDRLDEAGISRATVETVAENTNDGEISILFWLLIGGAPLGMLAKAVNTMDSMLGYRNEKYRYFGTAGARLDDVMGYIPARLTALLFVAAAALLKFDAKGAWRIWRRDHAKSPSPNSAHCESAVAGALGVRLLGPAYYFGKLSDKEWVGDATREIEAADIQRACQLLYGASTLGLVAGCVVRIAVILALGV